MIDIVRKPPEQRGFDERTLARLTAHRRPARNYERDPQFSEEMIRWAAINQMLRRIAPRQARRTTATSHPHNKPELPPLRHSLSTAGVGPTGLAILGVC